VRRAVQSLTVAAVLLLGVRLPDLGAAEPQADGYVYVNPEASSSMRHFWIFRPLRYWVGGEGERSVVGDSVVWFLTLRHDRGALLSGCVPPPWLVFWDSTWSASGKAFWPLRRVDGEPWDSSRTIPYELRLDQVDTLVVHLGFPAGQFLSSVEGEPITLRAHVELKGALKGTRTQTGRADTGYSVEAAVSPGDPTCPQFFRFLFDLHPPVLIRDSTRVSPVGGTVCAYGWERTTRTLYAPYDGQTVRASFVLDDAICRAIDSVIVFRGNESTFLSVPPADSWSTPARLSLTLPLPDANGEYSYRVAAADTALASDPYDPKLGRIRYRRSGNWRNRADTVDFRIIMDKTAMERSNVAFVLQDPETGKPWGTDNADRVRASVQFTRLWSADDWRIRGVWKVALLEGKNGPQSFGCGTGVWTRAWEIPKTALTEGREFRCELPLARSYQPGERIVVTAAFLDSSGVISDTVSAQILFVGPIHLAFQLEDRTPQTCQDPAGWTNDLDSLGVRVIGQRTDVRRIDSIVVRYSWTDLRWGRRFRQVLPLVFCVPVRGEPPECQPGVVTIEALETETGARTSVSDTIRFDFTRPTLTESFLGLWGAQGDLLGCRPLAGWTAGRVIRAEVGVRGYGDNCASGPVRVRVAGDVVRAVDSCFAGAEWLSLGLSGDPGAKWVVGTGMDWAGNWAAFGDSDRILYDPLPVDVRRVRLSLYRGDRLYARVSLEDRWDAGQWGVRGAWKVGFRLGLVPRDSFSCATGVWGDSAVSFELPWRVLRDGDTLSCPLPRGFDTGADIIWVTAAFLDSSGVLSDTVKASFRQLPFDFRLADPTPAPCQDRFSWTNDPQAILLQVVRSATNQARIDSLAIHFDWTDTVVSWTGKGLPDSLLVPLPSVPQERCRPHLITVEAWEVSTGANTRRSYTIRFDLESPDVSEEFLSVIGARRDTLECSPLAGWTSVPVVRAQTLPQGFHDACGTLPSRVRLELNGRALADSCSGGLSQDIRLNDVPGVTLFSASASDSAGNSSQTADLDTMIYDPLPVDSALARFWLADADGRDTTITDDHHRVRVWLRFSVPWAPSEWRIRGVWKVGLLEGKRTRVDFACSAFDWGDTAHVRELGDRPFRGAPCDWLMTLSGKYGFGDTILVTAAFLDSSGVISQVKMAGIVYRPVRFAFQLLDPTPEECQDRFLWSNDRDAIRIWSFVAEEERRRIDSLIVRFSWSGTTHELTVPGRLPDSLDVPLPAAPPECAEATVTIEAWERSTRAKGVAEDSIRFDLSPPALHPGFVRLVGSKRRTLDCAPLPGWTANDSVQVWVGAGGYGDNCSSAPRRIAVSGSIPAPTDTCLSQLVEWMRVTGGPGSALVAAAAMDAAGNWASKPDSEWIVLDPVPADSSVLLSLRLLDPDSACAAAKGTRTDDTTAVRVCVRLRPWDVSSLASRGIRDMIGVEGWVSSASCSVFETGNPQPAGYDQWLGFEVPLSGRYRSGDTIRVTVFFRDSSGVLSPPFHAMIRYLPLPSISISVRDDDDPLDATYVDSTIVLALVWSRVPKGMTGHLKVSHVCPGGLEETLADTSVDADGQLRRTVRIHVRARACYEDSILATLVAGEDTVTSWAKFWVDLVPPAIEAFCIVPDDGSQECTELTTNPRVYARIRTRDASCGALKRIRVYYRHATATGAADSAEAGIPECAESSTGVWVPLDLAADQTGWWRFWAKVEDCQEQLTLSDTVLVDYRPEGKAAFCYPNPFRPRVEPRVCFSVYSESSGPGEVAIWDAFGFLVKRWKVDQFRVGVNDGCDGVEGLTWDGRNGANELVASGGYICRIRTPDGKQHVVKVGILR